jgi:hypothetical protein
MLVRLVRWFSRNLGNLVLAFIMAVVVWVAATISATDPNQESIYPRSVPSGDRRSGPGYAPISQHP